MKKNIWGIAALSLLAMLATSCANEAVEKKNNDNVINYGVATGKQTLSRAAETITTTLESGFEVFVHYTTGGEYEHSPLQVSGSDWDYVGGPYYHPTNGLSHYAIYPTTAPTTIDGEAATYDITVSGDTDIVAASATTTATNATAEMTFKHLLSKINFVVTSMADETIALVVSDIELHNIDNAALFTLPNDNSGVWGGSSATGDFTYNLSAEGAGLMLLPQQFTADLSTGYFTFTYTMTQNNVVIGGDTVTMALGDLTPVWASGTGYRYVISFEGPEVITYDVNVDPWAEDTNVTVTVQ